MTPALVVVVYLGIVLYIGIFAFRRGKTSGEDYFLASRSLGQYIFLLALFGTNMTAFSILGASGLAYHRGIGVFGLLASAFHWPRETFKASFTPSMVLRSLSAALVIA